jgi:DNA mismatch repair protein MSH4
MLGGLSSVPRQLSVVSARTGIDTLLFLREALKLSKALSTVLNTFCDDTANMQSPLLHNISLSVWCDDLIAIEDAINTMLSDTNPFSKSQQELRHLECFAIKSGVDGLLDVARKTYLQTVEEIYQVHIDLLLSFLTGCLTLLTCA